MKKFMLRNLPFSKKLLLIYFACVIVPLTLVSVFFFGVTIMKWEAKGWADIERNVNNVKYDIQQLFDKALLNVDYIYYNNNLYDLLEVTEEESSEYLNIAMEIDSMLQPFMINDTTQDVKIFTSNEHLYRSSVIKKKEDLWDESWYPEFSAKGLPVALTSYYDKQNKENILCVIKKLDYRVSNDDVHILKVDLPMDQIESILRANSSIDNIYLLNNNNVVTAVRGFDESCPEIEYAVGDVMEIDGNDVICESLNSVGNYKVVARYSGQSIGIFDVELVIFIILVLLSLLISTLLIKLIDKSVSKKLSELTICMQRLENEEFEVIDEKDTGLDEIGVLTRGMNCAVRKIEFLINEVYAQQMRKLEIEKEKEKAELNALMGQIDPHFMFNIFEVVRMKSMKNGDVETSNIMKSISTMFRRLINSKDDIITLREELVFVNAYLSVSNYSMDDEVDIKIDIDENALDCMVPKMSIQVFVENAFVHGLDNIEDERKFSLSVKEENEKLKICISDNGVGIENDLLKKINNGSLEQRKDGSGVGISNILKRLQLYFDDEFEFNMESVPFDKTQMIIIVPAKKE